MVIDHVGPIARQRAPLRASDLPVPVCGASDLLIRIAVCGVCHTELDEIEGRLPPAHLPMVPGHQVVGHVEAAGKSARGFAVGDRVGVAWIFSACGQCRYCATGRENLCEHFVATGRDVDGGYAEYMVVPAAFACPIPPAFRDIEAAPLLCAGAIGYRSLKLTNLPHDGVLGLMGFGASAHLVLKLARSLHPDATVYAFARNPEERQFARELGAAWAGATDERPPSPADAIIDTTPVWKPVLRSMAFLAPGGRLVINAIRKEDSDKSEWLDLSYTDQFWREKEIKSVANVTRSDVTEFLSAAAAADIKPEVQEYPMADANRALLELKRGIIRGAKVLRIT